MKKIKDPTLFQHIKNFLTVYLPEIRGKSNNTIVSYRDTINLYLLYLKENQNIPLEHVTVAHFNAMNITAFRKWLAEKRNNSISSCNLRLSGMRNFCHYLTDERILTYDDFMRICSIEKWKEPHKTIEILAIPEMKRLLELPDLSTKNGLRDRFYMALLYDSGCRNQEILSCRLEDIRIDSSGYGQIRVIGKGNKYRVTPLSAEVIKIFQEYKSVFHSHNDLGDYLFYTKRNGLITQMSPDNVARFLNKYEKILIKEIPHIPHLHPHLFRHTRAMHLYQAGMPLVMVSEWLGHSQLETTLIYAHADTEMKRKAVEEINSIENSVFTNENFKYADEENIIKKLYGLS